MAVTIQVKRGSRATLPVLALGEYGLTTDTKELFIGGPEGVNIQIAVLDNGGQIPEEQLPEMDVSQTLAQAELKTRRWMATGCWSRTARRGMPLSGYCGAGSRRR